MVGLVLESERCLQHDDGRVLVTGRGLTSRLRLLEHQQPHLQALEQGLTSIQDNIPITFTKVGHTFTKVGHTFTKVGRTFTKVGHTFTKVCHIFTRVGQPRWFTPLLT